MHATRPRHHYLVRTICSARRDDEHILERGLLLRAERPLEAAAVHGWRYEPADATYERQTLLLGGPIGFAISGLASALGNRRARRNAELAAAPQWRPLGPLEVIATTDRLLVWHDGAWSSVWYSAITRVRHTPAWLELQFATDPPYLLAGDIDGLAAAIDQAPAQGSGPEIQGPIRHRHRTAGTNSEGQG
jgi:hypothetical protein